MVPIKSFSPYCTYQCNAHTNKHSSFLYNNVVVIINVWADYYEQRKRNYDDDDDYNDK